MNWTKTTMSDANSDRQISASGDVMGPLELAVYRNDWKASRCRRLHGAIGIHPSIRRRGSFGTPSGAHTREEEPAFAREDGTEAPTPDRVVARLLLARLFDRNPSAMISFRTSAAVVVVDVADLLIFPQVAHQWRDVLDLQGWRFAKFSSLSDFVQRDRFEAVSLVGKAAIAPKDRPAMDQRAFVAIQLALPIIAITPSASAHLPSPLLEAADVRLVMPPIDASVIERTIRIVTGKRCRMRVTAGLASKTTLSDLLLSVRFDRTPEQCLERLVASLAKRTENPATGDLSLDDLHGLDDFISWARSTIADIEAWRRGEVEWGQAIDAGVVLNGPSGTGKTTAIRAFARESGLPFYEASYSKWQGSGEGHLGHFLREMMKDIREARSNQPAVVYCMEVDSFADRGKIAHTHKDYVVSVVNALLGEMSHPDQQLIFIGCTNDVTRCDPALIRPGRFNRVIQIGLPSSSDLEKMFRVRLGGSLADEPLDEISLLALGSTGADVERFVKDARRAARHAGRPLTLADLRVAIGGIEDVPDEARRRAAVHEGGHIVLSVVHNGPSNVDAVIGSGRGTAGMVASHGSNYVSGTAAECRRALQILLAGRAAEELVFADGGGNGAGGSDRSDLASATRIAAAMVGSYGLSGPHPLVYVAGHHATDRLVEHRYMRMAAQTELSNAMREAKRILVSHRPVLDAVAERLLRDRKIKGTDVHDIMKRLAAEEYRQSAPRLNSAGEETGSAMPP